MSETSPTSVQLTTQMQKRLDEIARLDGALQARFEARMRVDQTISRQLVSFQANKELASYRWYKYKEAFSAPLVEHFLAQYGVATGTLLDPFAGSGTALFAASNMGLDAYGIELLPIGAEIIKVRLLLESGLGEKDRIRLRQWAVDHPWEGAVNRVALPTLRITAGAYPRETAEAIEKYTAALLDENGYVQAVLRFALLCVLESTSFTRKDGQYLRWDHRSGRRVGSRPFDKGPILAFEDAISAKILQILADTGPFAANSSASTEFLQLQMFAQSSKRGSIKNDTGSCLDILPKQSPGSYSVIFTSPPYCNRYDYTRTYALELALLAVGEKELVELRQRLLSCTVENRAKDLLAMNPNWATAIAAADSQEVLQAILAYLEDLKAQKALNNNGIPRMVRGYFYELACVIADCARLLQPGAPMIMVNDNVRYAGADISVDLILSDLAEHLGFHAESIVVLPQGKGNSSQQMGTHGRSPLRKCIYVWRRV